MPLLSLLCLHALTTPLPVQDPYGHYRFEEGLPGQPAVGAGSLLDSGPLAAHGTPHGEPLYVSDAPPWCAGNDVALELDGTDDYLGFDSTFVFHAPFGDATLEFSAKVPEPGMHRDLFWTTLDPWQEAANRFHLNLNPGGEFWMDYRDALGNIRYIVAPGAGIHLDLDVWNHVAIVRTIVQDGAHQYRLFKNGALVHTHLDANPALPDAIGWTIAGRPGPYPRAQGLIDEVRMHERALAPYEFQFADLLETYCSPGAPNSADPGGARISALGCPSLGANDFGLAAQGLPPGVLGVFFYGASQVQIPFGNGTVCVGGTVTRIFPLVNSDVTGAASLALDLSQPPFQGGGIGTITAGSVWNFQLWYRDPAGFPTTFNFSDALEITFSP